MTRNNTYSAQLPAELSLEATAIKVDFYNVFLSPGTANGGNPLGVIRTQFEDSKMAAIATELGGKYGLSETVFLRRKILDLANVPIRIFTPAGELPFAGHPSLGAAVAIAEKSIPRSQSQAVVLLQEPAGEVQVDLVQHRTDWWANLTAPLLPRFVESKLPSAWEIADALRLTSAAITVEGVWSAGVPFLFVRLSDANEVMAIQADQAKIAAITETARAKGLYAFASLPNVDREWQVRMFAPLLGIDEDPATGGAATAFAGYVALHTSKEKSRLYARLHQGAEAGAKAGAEVGLPSAIFVNGFRDDAGALTKVQVGGIVNYSHSLDLSLADLT